MDLVREIAAGAALKPLHGQIFKLEDIAVGQNSEGKRWKRLMGLL